VDLQPEGKIGLVTGSTAGIGLAIACRLAGEGVTVIINGRSENRVGDAIAAIRRKHPHAELEAHAGDLSGAKLRNESPIDFPI
jgi:short-subunit dehydrogenase